MRSTRSSPSVGSQVMRCSMTSPRAVRRALGDGRIVGGGGGVAAQPGQPPGGQEWGRLDLVPLEKGAPLGLDDGERLIGPHRNLRVLSDSTHGEPPRQQWFAFQTSSRIAPIGLCCKLL